MIGVVTPERYREYRREPSDMHRLRYRVFKERPGWEVKSSTDQERDEFDDLLPVYILAFDQQGLLVGSWRLLPTTGPYMLREVFAQLLEHHVAPNDPCVWECSRFSVECKDTHSNCPAAVNAVTQELFCGLIEYCPAQGIRDVVTVHDIRIARLLPRIGCHPRWRTRPRRIGRTGALAGRFDIAQTVLDSVRDLAGITGSLICAPHGPRSSRAA